MRTAPPEGSSTGSRAGPYPVEFEAEWTVALVGQDDPNLHRRIRLERIDVNRLTEDRGVEIVEVDGNLLPLAVSNGRDGALMGDAGITSGGGIGNRQLVGPAIGPNPQQQTGHVIKRFIESEPYRREPAAVGGDVSGENQRSVDNVGVGTRTTAHHAVVGDPPTSELVGIFEVRQRSSMTTRDVRMTASLWQSSGR